ncbi:helix-turn-helix domain-containing protein [uncultured Winogradskyella sp.]|uniref:winged helix-turn-helix domain-containing protein n=1 Tax=uncultured Winogradskyella sp. TaxID=395353 RepID=UPI002619E8DC|nr:helix-turn-helix domain-containing protein [uncultured Winogradskyella sp.]
MKSQLTISKSVALLEDENILIIYKEGNVITSKLEPQLTAILLKLIHSKNVIVTKEAFITSIWADNIFVGQTALRKNIYKLRNLIKKNHLEKELNIVTIPKKGYKLLVIESNDIVTEKRKLLPKIVYLSIAATLLLLLMLQFSSEEEDSILDIPNSEVTMTSK